jgi:hypothetical protein
LSLFKEHLVDLKNEEWLSNSIIDFSHWKLIDVLSKLGVKDAYKRFKFMDSGVVYSIFLAEEEYDFSAFRRWAMKKDVYNDGHIFFFLSHEVIVVPVNMKNMHWILFSIIPANREFLVVDLLYDPASPYHVQIYSTLRILSPKINGHGMCILLMPRSRLTFMTVACV